MLLVVFVNSSPSFIWDAFIWDALKLSPTKILETIGVVGLITNIAFSLVWQFVDMSTWQNVIASKNQSIEESQKTLTSSGYAVFFAPGFIGTAIGILLANTPDINSNNVMTHVLQNLPDNPLLVFFVLVALIAAIMSLIDGLLLATGYAVTHDILYHKETLEQLDKDEQRASGVLAGVRLFLALLAITGTVIVHKLLGAFHVALFDIVYILIICQLSLIGPVWIGLQTQFVGPNNMWYAIAAALVAGFGSVIWSHVSKVTEFMDAAGLVTIVVSLAVAWGIRWKYRPINV